MQIYVLTKDTKKYFTALCDESVLQDADENMVVLGAVDGDKPIGILAASVFLDELSVQWLYVAKEYRRKRVAVNLLKTLLKAVKKYGIKRIYLFYSKNNNGLDEFFKAVGFTINYNPGWISYESQLKDLELIKDDDNSGGDLSSFMAIPKDAIEELNLNLADGETLVGVPLKIDPRDFSPFSCCSIKDEKLASLILVQLRIEEGNDVVEIPWVFIAKNAQQTVPSVYNASIKALKSSFPPETKLHFNCINPDMDKVIIRLLPKVKATEIYMASYKL